MEVLTKSKPSNAVLENQKQTEKLKNTINYVNNKGEETTFDVHKYGTNGVIYFKNK